MHRKSPLLVPLLVVLAVAAACGDDDGAVDETTTTTTEVEETTTTSVDPFTVPDEITVEYVEAVLTELEKINGDALRLAMADGVTPAVAELIQPIYVPDLLAFRMNTLLAAESNGWSGIRPSPGDVQVEVVNVVTAHERCIAAYVSEDFTAVAPEGEESVELRVVLRHGDGQGNPTGWVYQLREPLPSDVGAGGDPCAG